MGETNDGRHEYGRIGGVPTRHLVLVSAITEPRPTKCLTVTELHHVPQPKNVVHGRSSRRSGETPPHRNPGDSMYARLRLAVNRWWRGCRLIPLRLPTDSTTPRAA